ncbi:MAG: glycosyltransferase [candidate division WOR-3 bacterium]|nr:glycosyltransferase [candidate division WOR-3 bacterium]
MADNKNTMKTAAQKGSRYGLSLFILVILCLIFGFITYYFNRRSFLPFGSTLIIALTVVLLAFLILLIIRYFFTLFFAYLHQTSAGPSEKSDFFPFVSILVPVYNEGKVIKSVLDSLLNIDYPDYEIIVIDDGSTDDTLQEIQDSKGKSQNSKLKVFSKKNAGKACALNYGLKQAKGEFIACIDGDSLINPEALRLGLRHFSDPKVGAVAGNVKAINRQKMVSTLQALEYVEGLNMPRRAQGLFGLVNIVPGPIGFFRRSALEAVGGYSKDTFAEDCDLTLKILSIGWKVRYEPEALAWTEVPETWIDLVKQRYRWTRGIIQSIRKHKSILFNPSINFGDTLIFWQMIYEAIIWPAMNIFAHLFFIIVALIFGFSPLIVFWWLQLLALDMMAALFCVACEEEQMKLIPYAILYRLIFILIIDIIKVFATIEEFLSLGMSWDKLERNGRVNGIIKEPV